jgi:hypothetical protein
VNRADKVATCPLACCVLRERISRVCAVYSSVASRPRSPRVGCRNCDAMKAVRTKLKKEPLALSALRRPRAAPATWARSGQPGAQPRRVAAGPAGGGRRRRVPCRVSLGVSLSLSGGHVYATYRMVSTAQHNRPRSSHAPPPPQSPVATHRSHSLGHGGVCSLPPQCRTSRTLRGRNHLTSDMSRGSTRGWPATLPAL